MQPREIKEREREQFPWACMHHQEEEEEEDESYETNALNRKTRRKPHPAHYQSRGALKSSPAPPPPGSILLVHVKRTWQRGGRGWSAPGLRLLAVALRARPPSRLAQASGTIRRPNPRRPRVSLLRPSRRRPGKFWTPFSGARCSKDWARRHRRHRHPVGRLWSPLRRTSSVQP